MDPDLSLKPSPEPSGEIPRVTPTPPSREPDIETPVPTGSVSVHIIPTTPIPPPLPSLPPILPGAVTPTPASDSHATAFSCSYEGQFYYEGEVWRPNRCTNCTCLSREILCKPIVNCGSCKSLLK